MTRSDWIAAAAFAVSLPTAYFQFSDRLANYSLVAWTNAVEVGPEGGFRDLLWSYNFANNGNRKASVDRAIAYVTYAETECGRWGLLPRDRLSYGVRPDDIEGSTFGVMSIAAGQDVAGKLKFPKVYFQNGQDELKVCVYLSVRTEDGALRPVEIPVLYIQKEGPPTANLSNRDLFTD